MSDWQGFYSAEQVSRLVGVPRATLYSWKRAGIVTPSVTIVEGAAVVDTGYSYADLAVAKLLRALKNRQLSLRSVARSFHHLYDRFGPPDSSTWDQAHVYVIGKDVFAQKPDGWETTLATRGGQRAEMRVLGELTEEEAALLIPKSYRDYVEIDLNVMEGHPVVRDTRVPTALLAEMFDEGMSLDLLADLYAPISREAIWKAVSFEKSLDEALQVVPTTAGPPAH